MRQDLHTPAALGSTQYPRGSARRVLVLVGATLTTLAVLLLGTALPSAQAGSAGGTPPGKAWIRAAHLVPGIGRIRIELVPQSGSGTLIPMSSGVGYGDVTSYRKLEPGSYTVNVRQQTAASGSSPMLSRSFSVTSGKASTVAVLGTTAAPRLAVLADDLTAPAAGMARVRVLSAASVAPTVSVTAVGGPTITTGAVLGQATPYAAVPDGKWTLRLSNGKGMTATQTISLSSGSVYTAVVVDSGTSSVALKVITDAAGAMATPKGGAKTGGGGTAVGQAGSLSGEPHHDSPAGVPAFVLLGTGMLLAGAASRRARRRSVARLDRCGS